MLVAVARKAMRNAAWSTGEDLALVTFYGAAGGEVPGSCTLLESATARVLVDCGLVQGQRARQRNERRFPFDPAAIDAVLLTHAHVDHSGLLPKLVREGFRGPIHATRPSRDLLAVLLRDSAHIQDQEARAASLRRPRPGQEQREPAYRIADVERTLELLALHAFDEEFELAADVNVRFKRAGHILGAASIECRVSDATRERKLVFSGDLGRPNEPLLLPPEPPREADLVVLESTYGDRDHKPPAGALDELARAIELTVANERTVIMPVFAVGRAQEILHHIGELERSRRIPEMPVYLDSPMAIEVTELYRASSACFRRTSSGAPLVPSAPRRLALCRTPEESMRLNGQRGMVILAASGMCEGGRILYHLRHHLGRDSTDLLVSGFQAPGTLGRALVDGARSVRLLGESVSVRARVATLDGFSAHAGQSELVQWVAPALASGARIALLHGEDGARHALAAKLATLTQQSVWRPARRDLVRIKRRGEPVVFENRADRRAQTAARLAAKDARLDRRDA